VGAGWGLIGWVNAETRDSLLGGLARIADRLGLADPNGDSLESARRLREHLSTQGGTALLVFDNATDPDGLRPLLAATGTTQFVITTTDRSFTEFGQAVDVDVFSRVESVNYLQERTGLNGETGAATVAAMLGDLPLALAQAGATMRRRHLTYSKYLKQLREVPLQVLLGHVPGSDYPHAVAAALLLSIEATEASDSTVLTRKILSLLAVLSPDGVRRDLLNGLGAELGVLEPDLDVALERCVAGSLLSWSVAGDTVLMHRLLARILRERDQAKGQWTSTINFALDLLGPQLFPLEEAWVRREDAAHLTAQVEALSEADLGGTSGPDLYLREMQARHWVVGQLGETGDLNRAIAFSAQTLFDSERVLGTDHPGTFTARGALGHAYLRSERLDEAIALLEQNLADRRRVLGADDPQNLTSYGDLARAYELAGRLDEAIHLCKQNLAEARRILGADHPETFATRANLSYAYLLAKRLDKAIPLYKQNLTKAERIFGVGDPETLTPEANLAFAYRSAGRLNKAIQLYEQNLAKTERIFGVGHLRTFNSRNNLAVGYGSAGRLAESIPLLEQNLAESERIFGVGHRRTFISRNNLARAYLSAGRPDKAIPLFGQDLAESQRILGDDHPQTVNLRHCLEDAIDISIEISRI
jgi:tetratricopeptide (TPR) repeat protein